MTTLVLGAIYIISVALTIVGWTRTEKALTLSAVVSRKNILSYLFVNFCTVYIVFLFGEDCNNRFWLYSRSIHAFLSRT